MNNFKIVLKFCKKMMHYRIGFLPNGYLSFGRLRIPIEIISIFYLLMGVDSTYNTKHWILSLHMREGSDFISEI